ncbi:NUDIX hydrolase domain-like protein [Podospora appendiculata]|uniref:NUDIX hydrolase domain-like protein n=1 Tax=Podospora appendiculata TaxID=314037 RepID=A0AAE0XB93_9PEZI|nr:NUDIX hydrolase domain-like protein [Podospora appendiculata]
MAASHDSDPAPPDFEIAASLAEFTMPAAKWLTRNATKLQEANLKLNGLATGVVVFNPAGKVLLVQRASHDSMPDRWEIPGGAVDDDDTTIVHGAARELREEAGLVARRFGPPVTGFGDGTDLHVFPNRNATRWFCRFVFIADVVDCEAVRLDPNEHQDFVWAREDEVRGQRVGGRDIPITHETMRAIILKAFRLREQA